MHHVALDRPRADDGDLDDEVVVTLRLQPRQHGHLRARLDLKHAHRVGATDHLVDAFVLGGHGRERELTPGKLLDELEAAADRAQHAEAEHVDLHEPELLEIVLVPLDHRAVRHRRVLDRHELVDRPLGDDEAAYVLRQMPWETEQRLGELDPAPYFPALGIEARLAYALLVDDAALPPLQRARERADLQLLDAERLADVADRAAAAISDDRGRQCGSLARVLAVDVLNDLLAPLVLEIDVDVGRLVALLRDEAFDQRLHAVWVYFRNTQAEADDGVGGRPATLAQDADAARMADDVVDRQEIRFVAQLGDQLQLVLDQRANLGRLAFGPTPAAAALRQRAEIRRRRLSGRYQLVRVLVAQLRERKIRALEYRERLAQQLGRITANELVDGPQASFGIRMQLEAERVERNFAPNGGQRVLQHAPLAAVHVNVAGRDQRHGELASQGSGCLHPAPVVALVQELDGHPQAPFETLL